MKDKFGKIIKPGSVLYSTRYNGFDLVLSLCKKSIICTHILEGANGNIISEHLKKVKPAEQFAAFYVNVNVNVIISPESYISLKDGEVNKEIWKQIRIIKSELKMQ